METITDNDSDCEIHCVDLSTITVADTSHDTEVQLERDLEDGEVCDESFQDDNVLFEIHFHKKVNFDKYGTLIANILKEELPCASEDPDLQIDCCIQTGEAVENNFTIRFIKNTQQKEVEEEILIHISGESDVEVNESDNEIQRKVEERRQRDLLKEQSPDLTGIIELFAIDTEPDDKLNSDRVPSYKRTIKDAMLDKEAATEKKLKLDQSSFSKQKPTNTCFNCGESSHSLRECRLPRQQQRIKNAIKTINKTERYHIDAEQRFSNFKPGHISDKLREALGLRRGELPFFFYRMRTMGYPPAWLEDAKMEKSGMTLFNSDGTEVLESDKDEDEIVSCTHKYNTEKIIDFPGFNQQPGEHFYDDYKFHNVPPFAKHQLKSEFIKTLGDSIVNGYKRKKLRDFPSGSTTEETINNVTSVELEDMEIEDSDTSLTEQMEFTRPPPPPSEEPPGSDRQPSPPPIPLPLPPPSPPVMQLTYDSSPTATSLDSTCVIDLREEDEGSNSPSLAQLEAKQQKLLQELISNNSTILIETDDSLIDEVLGMEEIPVAIGSSDNDNGDNPEPCNDAILANVIKESHMGVPLLKFSPYDALPTGEKFKTGVSDVINFENLPDSTGKYEQMKEVLTKVRQAVQKLHHEDDK